MMKFALAGWAQKLLLIFFLAAGMVVPRLAMALVARSVKFGLTGTWWAVSEAASQAATEASDMAEASVQEVLGPLPISGGATPSWIVVLLGVVAGRNSAR